MPIKYTVPVIPEFLGLEEAKSKLSVMDQRQDDK